MHNPQLPNREAVARIVKGARLSSAFGREFRTGDGRLDDVDLDAADAILALIPSPDQGEAEYVTITLSRDGTVTSHNAFDADFDEMVVAIQTIVTALQARLEGRGRCPYSHGAVLRKEPLSTPPVDSAKPGEDDEAYEIGKQEGYADAVQWIDARTGGDGEYRYCLGMEDDERHCPGPVEMREKIVARFNDLAAAPSLAEVRDAMADVMKLRRLSSTPEERETANKAIAVWDRLDKALSASLPEPQLGRGGAMSDQNDFGWALAQMRAGKRVRRRGWDAHEWIILRGADLANEDGTTCRFNDNKPLLAVDWVEAD